MSFETFFIPTSIPSPPYLISSLLCFICVNFRYFSAIQMCIRDSVWTVERYRYSFRRRCCSVAYGDIFGMWNAVSDKDANDSDFSKYLFHYDYAAQQDVYKRQLLSTRCGFDSRTGRPIKSGMY